MHAIPYTSPAAMVARLEAKRLHGEPRPRTKPQQRIRKASRREFRAETALQLKGAFA